MSSTLTNNDLEQWTDNIQQKFIKLQEQKGMYKNMSKKEIENAKFMIRTFEEENRQLSNDELKVLSNSSRAINDYNHVARKQNFINGMRDRLLKKRLKASK